MNFVLLRACIAEVVPVSMPRQFHAGGNFLYSLCFQEKHFVLEPQSLMGEGRIEVGRSTLAGMMCAICGTEHRETAIDKKFEPVKLVLWLCVTYS